MFPCKLINSGSSLKNLGVKRSNRRIGYDVEDMRKIGMFKFTKYHQLDNGRLEML